MINQTLKLNKLIYYKPTLQRLIRIHEDYSSVYLKIFLSYLQIIAILLSFNLDLPVDLGIFFNEFSSLNSNFILRPSCILVDITTYSMI